jgi:lysophospholipase L1-like esterase
MSMADDQNKRTLPWKHKALFSLAALFIFLVLLEIVLRVLGLFAPERIFTAFTGPDGRAMVRYELNDLKPEFSAEKARGSLRIMIAGGSTALGFPYQPRSSIGQRLAVLLEDTLPDTRVEVINLGRMGMDSAEVEEVVRRALAYGPDLVIVYSGQNEFISRLRLTPALKALAAVERGWGPGRLRVAGMLARAATLLTGGAVIATMKSVEENPEEGLTLPPPTPLSPAVYQEVLEAYRVSLEKIVRDCQGRGVPVVLSTMASNLRDWPPDLRSAPPDFPDMYRRQALETILQAREMTTISAPAEPPVPEQHHGVSMPPINETMMNYKDAIKLLAGARDRFAGYAAISFELGRVKTALVEADMRRTGHDDRTVLEGDSAERKGGAGPEPVMGLASDLPGLDPAYREKLRAEALQDFQRARDDEARVVMSNRAPSAVNQIVREVAASEHALLLDSEKLIQESSYLAPGFDWFDDHCHPNLWGQQVIAEAFYDLIRDSAEVTGAGPALGGNWSKLEWTEPSPWEEQAFLNSQGIDEEFLHGVFLRMGIYLGLEKDLPDHSRATRERLSRAAETDPSDPLPVVLSALVAADYGETGQAAQELRAVYPARRSDLEKCLARYFAAAGLRQGVFMARLTPGPGNPPLRGLLKSGLFEAQADKSSPALTPLGQFNFFLDLDAGGADVSGAMEQGLENSAARSKGVPAAPLVLADAGKGDVLKPGPGARLLKVDKAAQYGMESASAFLTTGPVRIAPADYDTLLIAEEAPASDEAPPAMIAWAGVDVLGRPAGAFIRGADLVRTDDGWRAPLSRMPRWVMAREVTEIRIVPGRGGTFELSSIKLMSSGE